MTTSIDTLITNFLTDDRPVGVFLDDAAVLAQAVAATKFYAGYAQIASTIDVDPAPAISKDTELSDSEWAIIRPLFILYLEREEARYVESSRGMGVESLGRMSSEISGDIALVEQEIPHKAFYSSIATI